jgi:membrane protease YdiL (CAAX protease family)
VCEEALFRGAINALVSDHAGELIALLLTSVAFAYVHFIGHMREFSGMIPLYSFVGGALWCVWWLSGSLAAVAAAHATYNFLAIVSMKLLDRSSSSRLSQTPS